MPVSSLPEQVVRRSAWGSTRRHDETGPAGRQATPADAIRRRVEKGFRDGRRWASCLMARATSDSVSDSRESIVYENESRRSIADLLAIGLAPYSARWISAQSSTVIALQSKGAYFRPELPTHFWTCHTMPIEAAATSAVFWRSPSMCRLSCRSRLRPLGWWGGIDRSV
jgi:hypothetical protein